MNPHESTTSTAAHNPTKKENPMTNQKRPYEPLTSENAALVLVDHQVGLMTGVRDYSTGELKHNVVALARAAKALRRIMAKRRETMDSATMLSMV